MPSQSLQRASMEGPLGMALSSVEPPGSASSQTEGQGRTTYRLLSRGCYEFLRKSRLGANLRTRLAVTMSPWNRLWKLICVKVHNTL